MPKFLILLCIGFVFTCCSGKKAAPSFSAAQVDSLKQDFSKFLLEKNRAFKNAEWSPLTEQDKAGFTALDFFPYNPDWRFEGKISVYEDPDSTQIMGSKPDDIRPALKYGFFSFKKEQNTYRLEIIKILSKQAGGPVYLFLGFWDKTSGNETYGGGRYIDLQANDDNYYIVDFNYAYNPYCAYSDRYSCAVPPWDNRLDIAISAGEKKYNEH